MRQFWLVNANNNNLEESRQRFAAHSLMRFVWMPIPNITIWWVAATGRGGFIALVNELVQFYLFFFFVSIFTRCWLWMEWSESWKSTTQNSNWRLLTFKYYSNLFLIYIRFAQLLFMNRYNYFQKCDGFALRTEYAKQMSVCDVPIRIFDLSQFDIN